MKSERVDELLLALRAVERELRRNVPHFLDHQLGVPPEEVVTRRIREDGDEHGMLVYGYKFRPAAILK